MMMRHPISNRAVRAGIGLLVMSVIVAVAAPSWAEPTPAATTALVAKFERPKVGFSVREVREINGQYVFEMRIENGWKEVGKLNFTKDYWTRSIDVASPPGSGDVAIRIRKVGGGTAHLDMARLNDQAPRTKDGRLLKKLQSDDNDVIELGENGVALEFARPQNTETLRLTIRGRIEATRISEIPFQYPLANMFKPMSTSSTFYEYRIGSAPGRLKVDGSLEGEHLGKPFMQEYYTVGSGHPQGTTYGWVRDDGSNLYVAFDVTGDNTKDGGKDYTKVYVKTEEGLKEFKITTEALKWGLPGFEYTPRVAYEHKVYEFKIPFAAMGLGDSLSQGRRLELAFAAYGTFSPEIVYSPSETATQNGVMPDQAASGSTFTFIVSYGHLSSTPPQTTEVLIDLDGDGMADGVALTAGAPPKFPSFGGGVTLVGLAVFVLWLAWRTPRRRPVLASLGLAILVAGGALACSSSDDGSTPPGGTTSERHTMTIVNPPFGPSCSSALCEDYVVDVQIGGSARTVNFAFNFTDDGGSPVTLGNAQGTHSLTLQ